MNALCGFRLRANIAWRAGLDAAFAAFGLRIVGMRWHPRGTEAKLYQAILASQPHTIRPVIFDVGANVGQTTLAFKRSIPCAEVHAFEMVPSTFNQLVENTCSLPYVILNPFGLSDRDDQRTIRLNNDPLCNSVRATVGDENTSIGYPTTTVRLRTLDAYCAERNIERIDILKSDTEGHELAVLDGAGRWLREHRIQAILVECTLDGMSNDHVPLAALTHYLSPYGFALFGLYDLGYEWNGRLSYLNALFVHVGTASPVTSTLDRNAVAETLPAGSEQQ
jgi:FkbM family methyltransferase